MTKDFTLSTDFIEVVSVITMVFQVAAAVLLGLVIFYQYSYSSCQSSSGQDQESVLLTVPPIMLVDLVVIPDDPEREFVVGTTRTFTCSASFTNIYDIANVMVNITWDIFPSSLYTLGMQYTSQYAGNLFNFTSTLSFNLLDERAHHIECLVLMFFSGHFVVGHVWFFTIRKFQCKCNILKNFT